MPPQREAPEDITTPKRATRRKQPSTLNDDNNVPKRATRRTQQPAIDATPTPNDEPDELNLSSTKLLVPPSTPGPRPGTPRVVMDCVEITTPRAFTLRASTAYAFPLTNDTAGLKVKCPSILKAPLTPSRKTRPVPASPLVKAIQFPLTPSRLHPPHTPRISPSKVQYQPDDVLASPSRQSSRSSSPKKLRGHTSPVTLPEVLPAHLVPCLRLQKRAILNTLQSSLSSEDLDNHDHLSTNSTAYTQLHNLLDGTVTRGEGNSCLLLGPRGSGKTSLIERVIRDFPDEPIVLQLSGHTQHNDRLALREIARQLSQQTGKSFLCDPDEDVEEEPNPFIDPGPSISAPPPSHLPALISVLPTLSRPTIVILDAFDLFAQHARQSLLYCLLDTVQSCKVGQGNNGLAVVGITTRIDTINLLEKRVKSRFSGRMIRTAPPSDSLFWINMSRRLLGTPINDSSEWSSLWNFAVHTFLEDRKVVGTIKDTFALTRDVRMLKQILIATVTNLRATSPFPMLSHISAAISAQRLRPKFSHLQALSYPSICLLVATMHAYSAGHDVITFEMLHDTFREEFRASSAAPIQIEGGSIGMAKCTREVLMRSFEDLVSARMFTSVAAPSVNVAPEFVRYRCAVERVAVKQAVIAMGQTNMKKWLNKAS